KLLAGGIRLLPAAGAANQRRGSWLAPPPLPGTAFARAGSDGPEAPGLDVVLLDLIAQDSEAGVQQVGGLALVAPGLAQGFADQLLLQFLHPGGQAAGSGAAGLLALQ